MEEYSRIVIEEYCRTHNSAKSCKLFKLVQLSYDLSSVLDDADAQYLENAIEREKDEELKSALEDLGEYFFI